jgi:hypothetical protein
VSNDTCTEESFLNDISSHKMTVLLNNGLYRHIRFKRPNTGNMYFDLITAPDLLLYRGDMGCYEFERIPDMFEFFRSDRESYQKQGKKVPINIGYWGEKLQSVSCFGDGYREYSQELFNEEIEELVQGFLEDNPEVDEEEFREAINDDVLSMGEFECEARHAVDYFEFNGRSVFCDFFEARLTRPTYHYTWACYAIAWGIQQYDKDTLKERLK